MKRLGSLFSPARFSGEASPAVVWYTMMAVFVTLSIVGAVFAYDRYRWATSVVEIDPPKVVDAGISRSALEDVIATYEKRRAEYDRLMRGGALSAPPLSAGSSFSRPTSGSAPSSASEPKEPANVPEFY